MLYLYDKAVENKFKQIFDRTIYAPTDKFYDRFLMSKDGKQIQLPALSIWRVNSEFIPYNAKTQVSIPNFSIRNDKEYNIRNLYSMQMRLDYQLDIWAGSDIDRDDLMKELLYFIVTYPDIYIEYENTKFEFPILVESPDDITDISQFESSGDLYRMTIPLSIPDARLMYYQDSKICKYIDISYYANNDFDSRSRIGKERSTSHDNSNNSNT